MRLPTRITSYNVCYTKLLRIRTLCMMMGGRAAEYIVFNHLTTGASNDLERATTLARKTASSPSSFTA